MAVRGNYTWAPGKPHTCPFNHRCEEPSKPSTFPLVSLFVHVIHPSINDFLFFYSECNNVNKRLLDLSDDDIIQALIAIVQ